MLNNLFKFKMISIISLISILTIFTQINCVPIQPNAESRDSSKFLNLYESNINGQTAGLNDPINDFKEDNFEDEENWEEEFLRIGRKNCKVGSDTRHVCERCAKITKSEKGYAYCCMNKHEIRAWCENYIGFLYSN